MFARVRRDPLVTQIKANYRAIADRRSTADAAVGGTLEAGDHVDLVGTYTVHPPVGHDYDISRIIVRDVLVLKAPQTDASTGKLASSQRATPSVTLEVPDTVAPKITFTLHAGDGRALASCLRPAQRLAGRPRSRWPRYQSVIFDGTQRPSDPGRHHREGRGHSERLTDQGLHHRRGQRPRRG